ncbi:hypothetical protein ACFL2Q_18615 [Thermodesulfobacteriota bacterium]
MYSKERLQALVREVLVTARSNLLRDGHLQPCGLLYSSDPLTHIFPFNFENFEKKRLLQDTLRKLITEVRAAAAVVILESWIKMARNRPLDLTRPVSEMPGRQEAIVVEAASHLARTMIIQVFVKSQSGLVFEIPFEPDHPLEWNSERLSGIWPDRT